MSTQWTRYAVVGASCMALGALASQWVDRCPSEGGPAPEIETLAEPNTNPKNGGEDERAESHVVDTGPQALTVQQLQALGYVEGTYDPNSDLTGTVINEAKKTSPGYNFYSSFAQTGASLIDMDGRKVHEWHTDQKGQWAHAELLPNGDVIALIDDQRLARYDKDSKLIWSVDGGFHHDFWIHGDEIYALTRVSRVITHIHPKEPIVSDAIQVHSLDGELKREIALIDAIHDSGYIFLFPTVVPSGTSPKLVDGLHANHVEVFDGRLADRNPIYAEGNILVSMRDINAIAILHGESLEVIWIWGPTNLTAQHHPTLLDNGHILLFDNGKEFSRVLEIDPLSYMIAWQYGPRKDFFSRTRGSNQRLPNGNTLITESDTGYVFEVTPRSEVVWQFVNPLFVAAIGSERTRRQAIWRMTRVAAETLTFLD